MYLEQKNNKDENKYTLENLSLFNNTLNLIKEKYFDKIRREYAEKTYMKNTKLYKENEILINEFIKFYNSLKIKDKNDKIIELSKDNHLSDFFVDEKNTIGATYKNIYKEFIKIYNEKNEYLFDIKRINKIKICIQNFQENEIFNFKFPENTSIYDIFYDSAYRKISKEYIIDFDKIEERMTDLLLKNKKIFNDEIHEYIYNEDAYFIQLDDEIITKFKERYDQRILTIYDKVNIYKFSLDNKDNSLIKNIIKDFLSLLNYLNSQRERKNQINVIDNEIKEETKISEIIENNANLFTNNFKKIFENKYELTVGKTFNIFDYYLKTVYEDIKKELYSYNIKLDNNSKELLNKLYEKECIISKKDLAFAIRLFSCIILFNEKNKIKIKNNYNNITNYLNYKDLWKKEVYDDQDFNRDLFELKKCNFKINQIILLYEFLGGDINEGYFDDVNTKINDEKEEEEKEDDDFNRSDDDKISEEESNNDNENVGS